MFLCPQCRYVMEIIVISFISFILSGVWVWLFALIWRKYFACCCSLRETLLQCAKSPCEQQRGYEQKNINHVSLLLLSYFFNLSPQTNKIFLTRLFKFPSALIWDAAEGLKCPEAKHRIPLSFGAATESDSDLWTSWTISLSILSASLISFTRGMQHKLRSFCLEVFMYERCT